MKRWIGYAVCILGLCAFFTTCYYISFRNALNKFNEGAIERDSKILESFEEYQKQATLLKQGNVDNTTNEIRVDAVKEEVIEPTTKYFLEIYNVKTNQLTREEFNPTSELIGMNRSEVIQYLANYMLNMPLHEKNQGLYAYDLLQFSKREVVIRKSYNEDIVTFRYYLAVKDGKVIIYYSDLTTIYEYTTINVADLPEADREDLMHGVYVKTDDELFALLESYSS
ncbi:MAG: BofC C-terminal domain-containing protein [Clostridiales bacterium]|nr:BofC C-terminal domain-containing protein [Clostridiales bacterium]